MNQVIALIVEQVIVTLCTIADFQLQVVQPVYILQEILFLQAPRSTDSPERTPAVVLVET